MFNWKNFFYSLIGNEISQVSRYADKTYYIEWQSQNKQLFGKIDCVKKEALHKDDSEKISINSDETALVILNGTFNYDLDIQGSLQKFYPLLSRSSRIVSIIYNPYWSFLYKFASRMGLISGGEPVTFLTQKDLEDICKLSGYEIVRYRPTGMIPFKLFGLGTLLNKTLCAIPLLRELALTHIITLRPVKPSLPSDIKLSIVIPARNEAGNIENALKRMPSLPCKYEVIFIEGNSTDNTWDEINRVYKAYSSQFELIIDKQQGKGKADAVEKGFSLATGNLLTILDADLTMPPELLPRFVDAYMMGKADFVNGSRLLYPMEGKAMRFLNKLGNIFFANALSFVLENRLTDSLCGTKMMSKKDYNRFMAWRNDFGKFDPFGDFDLLFPASVLSLGMIDIPIRYLDRTYGETNISRFRHGLMLLKMTLVGLFKIRIRV